ncbi:MAG: iron(III) transport system substrate-binding protein [Clostridium sp.]|jgi:iron(III) transport system substrate-binding protein
MKSKKILTAFLASMMVISLLSGCGNKAVSTGKELGKDGFPNLKGEKLVVYVVFHEEEGKRLLELFEEKTGCDTSYLSLPTGEALTRTIFEKDAPKADIFLGGPADVHEALKDKGVSEKYVSKTAKDIPDQYKDKDGFWTGMYVGPLAIGLNTDLWDKEFASKGLKKPETYEDLINPAFKGEIVMPDPATSGTAYTFISTLVQSMGEDKAFEYFQKLKNNVAQFTSSGFAPVQKVGSGEYLMCVNFIEDQLLVKKSGFPVQSIIPPNAGWQVGSTSIIKNGPNSKSAKAFIDFVLSKEAGNLQTDLTQASSTRSDVRVPEGGKKVEELSIFKDYDPKKAGADKIKLVTRWNSLK